MDDKKDVSSYDWVDIDLCVEVAGDLLHELPKLEDTLEGFELQTAVFSVFLQSIFILKTYYEYDESDLIRDLSRHYHEYYEGNLH